MATVRRFAAAAALACATLAGPGGAGAAGLAEGLYARAGIGLDLAGDATFADADCASTAPAALYGCGAGPDGRSRASRGEFGRAGALELGLGAAVAPGARIELLLEYRPDAAFAGRANFLAAGRRQEVSAGASSLAGMAAAWLDLGALGAPSLGPFAPFVGAGMGAARVETGETRMDFPATWTIAPGASRTNFAWMATAGVSAPLGGGATLDLAWRYTDYGTAETGRGAGRVVWRDGSRDPLPLDLAPTRARMAAHGVRLSVRYGF